jgi:hypothetical protein
MRKTKQSYTRVQEASEVFLGSFGATHSHSLSCPSPLLKMIYDLSELYTQRWKHLDMSEKSVNNVISH